jgi:hypothetical protein
MTAPVAALPFEIGDFGFVIEKNLRHPAGSEN